MSNSSGGIYLTRRVHDQRLDALPPAIRQVYAAAPFNYAMQGEMEKLKAYKAGHLQLSRWRRQTVEMMCRDIMTMARRDYGPDHPDAQVSRLDRRRSA